MQYRVDFTHSARAAIKKLDPYAKRAIGYAIWGLQHDPFRPGVKKLAGQTNEYRYRPEKIGQYRIVFRVYAEHLLIEVLKVGDAETYTARTPAQPALEPLPPPRTIPVTRGTPCALTPPTNSCSLPATPSSSRRQLVRMTPSPRHTMRMTRSQATKV